RGLGLRLLGGCWKFVIHTLVNLGSANGFTRALSHLRQQEQGGRGGPGRREQQLQGLLRASAQAEALGALVHSGQRAQRETAVESGQHSGRSGVIGRRRQRQALIVNGVVGQIG